WRHSVGEGAAVRRGGPGDRGAGRPDPAAAHPAERHGTADRAVRPVVFVRRAGLVFADLPRRWEPAAGPILARHAGRRLWLRRAGALGAPLPGHGDYDLDPRLQHHGRRPAGPARSHAALEWRGSWASPITPLERTGTSRPDALS